LIFGPVVGGDAQITAGLFYECACGIGNNEGGGGGTGVAAGAAVGVDCKFHKVILYKIDRLKIEILDILDLEILIT